MKRSILALLVALALLAAACGDSSGGDSGNESAEGSSDGGNQSCAVADLSLFAPGRLTVATGEAVFPPWMMDDDPTNGQGFESALVYALADRMGFTRDDVDWVRTGFDQAIAPGTKPYDFNIQQFSITPDRDEVVDFSIGYYKVKQALIAYDNSPVIQATSLGDLADTKLGAAIGTTSLSYIEDFIKPSTPPAVYDTNADAKAAMDANQVDGLVFDLPTAYFITAVEIPDASIVGVLPAMSDNPEELGMLFEQDSPLVPCVNEALQSLIDDGTVASLEEQWLNQGGDIKTLSK